MAELPDLSYAIGLPPKEAIAYFESKGYAISWNWWDVWQEAQAAAVTVAKVARIDILQDIRDALVEALKEGKTAAWFDETLTPVLQAKGWWGRQIATGPEGTSQVIQLGSPARLGLIYRQNLQNAYMASRWKAMHANTVARPYFQYLHNNAVRFPRLAHLALHGKVFRYDDPIWKTMWPPNGFGCACRIRALNASDLNRLGLIATTSDGARVSKMVDVGTDPRTGEIVRERVDGIKVRTLNDRGQEITVDVYPDPGFNYNPGAAAFEPDLKKYAPELAAAFRKEQP